MSERTERTGTEWLWHAELDEFPGLDGFQGQGGFQGLGSLVGYKVRSADDERVGTVMRTLDHPEVGLLVVNTGPWMFGRLLAVPAGLVTDIDQDAQLLHVACDKQRLRDAPAYRADTADAFAGYRAQATEFFTAGGEADRLTP